MSLINYILAKVLSMGKNDKISEWAAKHPNCPPQALAKVLSRGKNDWVSQLAASNPNCPIEALVEVVSRGNDTWVSRYALQNLECSAQALSEALNTDNYDVCKFEASDGSCPSQALIELISRGREKGVSKAIIENLTLHYPPYSKQNNKESKMQEDDIKITKTIRITKDSNQAFTKVIEPKEKSKELNVPRCPNCQSKQTCFCVCDTCGCNIHEMNEMRTTFETWYARNNTNIDLGDTVAGTLGHLIENRTPKGYKVGWFDNDLNDAWELFELGWKTGKKINNIA